MRQTGIRAVSKQDGVQNVDSLSPSKLKWDSASQPSAPGPVSVIVPVRNGEAFIGATIDSILAQGDVVGEIVVVDDGSTDDSAAVALAAGDPRIRIVRTTGLGLPAARNCGVRASSGAWLYFLDADDLVQPGALARLLAAAESAPQAGLVYGDYDRIHADGTPFGRRKFFMRFRRKPTGDVLESLVRKNCMVVGTQIVSRSVYDACGGFEESLKNLEDWHFWCRVAARSEFLFVPDLYVMSYRVHHTSMMHTRLLPFEAIEPAIEIVYGDPAIARRLDADRRARYRRSTEAAMMSYLASVAIRLGTYREGLRMILRSIRRDPAHSPRAVAQFAGAFVGL